MGNAAENIDISHELSGNVPLNSETLEDWDDYVRDAVQNIRSVRPNDYCGVVFDYLKSNLEYPAIAVVETGGAVAGFVTRNTCLSILAQPILLDLYSKRAVTQLMSKPLVVDVGTSIDMASEMIGRDNPQAYYDGFVAIQDGLYAGLVSPQ
jgi:hypothetical protein